MLVELGWIVDGNAFLISGPLATLSLDPRGSANPFILRNSSDGTNPCPLASDMSWVVSRATLLESPVTSCWLGNTKKGANSWCVGSSWPLEGASVKLVLAVVVCDASLVVTLVVAMVLCMDCETCRIGLRLSGARNPLRLSVRPPDLGN
jgi:hypothetical protein